MSSGTFGSSRASGFSDNLGHNISQKGDDTMHAILIAIITAAASIATTIVESNSNN